MVRNNVIRTLAPALALTGWQASEQYLTPKYEETDVDFLNDMGISPDQLLPFGEAILLGILAWLAASCFWDDKDKLDKHNTSPTSSKPYVGWNVFLSLAGAALAFVLTEHFMPEDKSWTAWLSGAAVGAGCALPGLIINSALYLSDSSLNTPKNIGISAACAFGAGLSWYVAKMLPELFEGNEVLMKGVVAPAVTFLATALFLGMACWADVPQVNTNSGNSNKSSERFQKLSSGK